MCHLPLPTGCSGRSNHNILSKKLRPGAASFQRAPGLASNVPLGQGGYKIPISFRMDFVISRALPPLAPSAASMFVAKT